MLSGPTAYSSCHFFFHVERREREKNREKQQLCVFNRVSSCVGGSVCVFAAATVMHACPQPEHKSSLQMAGVFVCVCMPCVHTNSRKCSIRCSTGCLIVTASMLRSTQFPRFPRPGTAVNSASRLTHARRTVSGCG